MTALSLPPAMAANGPIDLPAARTLPRGKHTGFHLAVRGELAAPIPQPLSANLLFFSLLLPDPEDPDGGRAPLECIVKARDGAFDAAAIAALCAPGGALSAGGAVLEATGFPELSGSGLLTLHVLRLRAAAGAALARHSVIPDCHSADTPSSPLLKHLLTGEGGAAE